MIIGHLSDLHVLAPGRKLMDILDTNALAERAVNRINTLDPAPDFVVVTGDLTHNGGDDETRHARAILDALKPPYLALPGGHDDLSVFNSVFGDAFSNSDAWARDGACKDLEDLRIVFINSLGDGEGPSFSAERARALNAMLCERPNAPTIVCMHHPPFQCRIPVSTYIDDPDASWALRLGDTLAAHDQVRLVLCGHVHRSMVTAWRGANVIVAPSTCVQVDPNFNDFHANADRSKRNFQLIAEDPSFMLHYWSGEDFISYVLPTRDDYARA